MPGIASSGGEPRPRRAEAPPAVAPGRDAAPARPDPATAPLASELVARADEAYARLRAHAAALEALRKAALAVIRGATPAGAAALANAAATWRAGSSESIETAVAFALETAHALLEAAGAAAQAKPARADEDGWTREERPDPSPPGTIVEVLAPAWRSATGELLAPGVVVVSRGPASPLERPLERAARAAQRLARKGEDVTGKFQELASGLAALDRDGEVARALEAVRFVEALAAPHLTAGQDVAESALAELVLFLEARGVVREPPTGGRVEPSASFDANEVVETGQFRVKWVEDAAPSGTVVKRTRSAFLRNGALVDGQKGEVTASLGPRTEGERRLADLARAQEPLAPLPRTLARLRRLAPAAREGEAGARLLVELLADLEPRSVEALAVEKVLLGLGAERFEPKTLVLDSVEVVESVPDPTPEGAIASVVAPGWRLRGTVLVPARVRVSLGPRRALVALLERVEATLDAGAARDLVRAAHERALALDAASIESTPGVVVAVDLAAALEAPGAPGELTRTLRELDAFLGARGVQPFPASAKLAEADLAQHPECYEVVHERSERPRGGILVLGRGFRDERGEVYRRARVSVSRGPQDPLVTALEDLARALAPHPVSEASPLARLAEVARELDAGAAGPDHALERAAEVARAAENLVTAGAPAIARAVSEVVERSLLPALAACGVEPLPRPGAEGLAPSQAELVDADVVDSPRPAGALLEVKRRGLVRERAALVRAQVVLSAGPRPRLLELAERVAGTKDGPLAALADLAGDLARKVQAARRDLALGRATELRTRDGLLEAGLAFLRAAERARGSEPAESPLDAFLEGELRPAVALAHEQVEVFPVRPSEVVPDEVRDDPAFELVPVFDDRAPAGSALRVLRAGVRDRRAGVAKLDRARVVVSQGRRPLLEEALDRIAALAHEDGLAVDEPLRALRDAARGLVRERGTPLEGRVREALAQAAAGLLDATEPRATGSRPWTELLDGSFASGLGALGVKVYPGVDDPVEKTVSRKLEVAREFSDAVPEGGVIARTRRGLELDGRAVRVARIVVSLGKKDDFQLFAEALEGVVEGSSGAVREPLEKALAKERSVQSDVRAGRTLPSPAGRASALVDAVNAALAAATPDERAELLEKLRAPLERCVARAGSELLPPAAGPLAPELLADAAALELAGADWDGGARGGVLDIQRLGVRRRGTVERAARVRVDLGPKPAWLAPADEAITAGASLPIVAAVRDARRPAVEEDAVLLALHDAHRATEAARPALDRALRALGAEVFPRAGEPLPAGLAPEALVATPAWAEGAAPGTVVRVVESGLRRKDRVLRPARAEVSRGAMSPALKALTEVARTATAVAPLVARLEALPVERHDSDEGDRLFVDALALLEAAEDAAGIARVVARLRERGYVVAPERAGDSLESLRATLGGDAALEAPRRRFGPAPAGEILAIERRAVVKAELVLAKARIVVCAGKPNEIHGIVQEVRDKLAEDKVDAPLLAELDEVLEKAADAKPDRMHFLAFPVMNVLHRLNAKDRHGAALKTFLRSKNVREITAYAGYPASELGPKKLDEVRVSSEREKGKIVKVLRPGYEDEKSGIVLQKVQAEVSR